MMRLQLSALICTMKEMNRGLNNFTRDDATVKLMETTTGRLSPSVGSPSGGKTRRLNSLGEPRAREEAATPEGRERARESEERTSASAESGGRDWRPCNDLTAMVTFLISARFNYTVDEEVLAHPPAPSRSSGASISLSTRFGSPSLLSPDEAHLLALSSRRSRPGQSF
ncbi:hypothetical protein ALC62_03503 [Cyphomyrmex costatus]|uniref:Uncharacterized protein n=1 Tax=Cyphomyrmex costatus TaxID=456900 RepID=A0A151ILF3_9HYME|nr:hypothetical protein ALC62_03503 [Cyphomyrmex costatus]